MFGSFKILTIWGIPIRVHFTLLILLPYFAHQFSHALQAPSVLWGWLAAVGLFVSVALHELGHSVVAIRHGCSVKDIILTPIGGIAQLARIPPRPSTEFQIAIAGPLVSLALGLIFLGLTQLIYSQPLIHLANVVYLIGATNIVLFLFNLIPCFPMDGGRIFRAAMASKWGRLEATRRAVKVSGYLAAVLAILGVVYFNIFWILIAWFVRSAAKNEFRMVQWEENVNQGAWNPWADFFNRGGPRGDHSQIDIDVSPPPYRK